MGLFDRYYRQLKYEEYRGQNSSGQRSYAPVTYVSGLKKSGSTKITATKNGDEVSSDIVYRVTQQLVKNSKLDGYLVVDCKMINALDKNTGYLAYVRPIQ